MAFCKHVHFKCHPSTAEESSCVFQPQFALDLGFLQLRLQV